ncbi:MAG TPA: polyprenyl synthetase family protein [Thermoanaerobaculia bacterium]
MSFDELKSCIRNLDIVSSWPQMLELVERVGHRDTLSVWEHPLAACRAVGGVETTALPAAAAVLCSVVSIHLVDDMLDEDPRGEHLRIGIGPAANLALAFQAAGHLLLERAAAPAEVRAALQESFARMSLATCYGQGLDARELANEQEYWRTVEAKTPPLFAEALRMGALLGGAPAETAAGLARLGHVLGLFIQVNDDLADVLETPARVDWRRRSNNLALLYAMTAEHAGREDFLRLSLRVDDPEALAAAQRILFRCGAVSYCTLKLIEFSRQLQEIAAGLPLRDPGPVERLVTAHLRPLHHLLERVGVEDPATLALC